MIRLFLDKIFGCCMAANFKDEMDGTSWENFCENMLRKHFTWKCFYSVPHEDRGDHGIEFFTSCGTIFQCYYPNPSYTMKEYKEKVQIKINKDLKKLKQYENKISDMLNGIKIKTWVLVIPHNRSTELIKYCSRKANEVKKVSPSFIDTDSFLVKIETDDSFMEESLYARNFISKEIDLKVNKPNQKEVDEWKAGNSEFYSNVVRKTEKISSRDTDSFRNELISKYVQINELLDAYREQYPELHGQLTSIALYNLSILKDDSYFEARPASDVLKDLLKLNREQFAKIAISRENVELLSFGWIAQWIAECHMDFIV